MSIKFLMTPADFAIQQAAIRTKLAALTGVEESAVVFQSSVGAARRLLQIGNDDSDHLLLEISAHVPVHTGTDLMGLM
jgi:hypothetical protein